MPHYPKPFFRESRKLWYVQLNGTQHNLGPNQEAAFKAYHKLMAKPPEKSIVNPDSLAVLIDRFLDFTKHHRAADTFEWYQSRLQRFLDRYPGLTVPELKPFHVQEWIDGYPNLAKGSKRNLCRSIMRAMTWAEQQGIIEKSPIAHFKKPAGGKRERVISDAEWKDLLGLVPDDDFRGLLLVSWDSGCRPQESLIVEARHVDLLNSRLVFSISESKTELPRVVYLTEQALRITKRLMERFPTAPLFRNSSGTPWTTDAVNCALIRIQIRFGIRVMKERGIAIKKSEVESFAKTLKSTKKTKGRMVPKTESELRDEARKKLRYRAATNLAPKFSLYTIRHTWMNRMLTSGVDALTVAILAGHSDPSTLAKTYQHLSQNPRFMLEQAKRAG
jgi:integrase